jgi:hypothetical protein
MLLASSSWVQVVWKEGLVRIKDGDAGLRMKGWKKIYQANGP